MITLIPSKSVETAVGATSTQSTLVMSSKQPTGTARYAYVATVDSWIAQGDDTVVASAGSGSAFVPAKTIVIVDGKFGAYLACIEDSTGGKSSLTPVIGS